MEEGELVIATERGSEESPDLEGLDGGEWERGQPAAEGAGRVSLPADVSEAGACEAEAS
ncbi:MAG: hypothetical protein ACKOGA_03400 [Planctomycetaceae bacterium]